MRASAVVIVLCAAALSFAAVAVDEVAVPSAEDQITQLVEELVPEDEEMSLIQEAQFAHEGMGNPSDPNCEAYFKKVADSRHLSNYLQTAEKFIAFKPNKTFLTNKAISKLKEVASVLKKYPHFGITVKSYSAVGGKKGNMLVKGRDSVVVNKLRKFGVKNSISTQTDVNAGMFAVKIWVAGGAGPEPENCVVQRHEYMGKVVRNVPVPLPVLRPSVEVVNVTKDIPYTVYKTVGVNHTDKTEVPQIYYKKVPYTIHKTYDVPVTHMVKEYRQIPVTEYKAKAYKVPEVREVPEYYKEVEHHQKEETVYKPVTTTKYIKVKQTHYVKQQKKVPYTTTATKVRMKNETHYITKYQREPYIKHFKEAYQVPITHQYKKTVSIPETKRVKQQKEVVKYHNIEEYHEVPVHKEKTVEYHEEVVTHPYYSNHTGYTKGEQDVMSRVANERSAKWFDRQRTHIRSRMLANEASQKSDVHVIKAKPVKVKTVKVIVPKKKVVVKVVKAKPIKVVKPPPVVKGEVVRVIRPTVVRVLKTTKVNQELAQKSYRQQNVRVISQKPIDQEKAVKTYRQQNVRVITQSAADQEKDEKANRMDVGGPGTYPVYSKALSRPLPPPKLTRIKEVRYHRLVKGGKVIEIHHTETHTIKGARTVKVTKPMDQEVALKALKKTGSKAKAIKVVIPSKKKKRL
jgi:outer membrane protein OmpA-like peptidoglycan-associated protein